MRSTMASPSPSPRTECAVSSSRWNSLKISERLATGMPGPVSCTWTLSLAPRRRHAQQHLSAGRVFDGIGHQVLQHAAQQPAIRRHPQAGGHDPQLEPFLAGQRLELDLQPLEHVVQGEGRDVGLEAARVEARDFDQDVEDFLHRFQRGIDVAQRAWPPGRQSGARPGSSRRGGPRSGAAARRGSPPPGSASCRDWLRRPCAWRWPAPCSPRSARRCAPARGAPASR